jgi:hypothetical protein
MKPRVFVYVKRGLACAVLLAVLLGATAVKTQDAVKTQERSDLAIS